MIRKQFIYEIVLQKRKIENMLRIFNDFSLNFRISNNITEDFEPFLKNKTYLQNPYKNWHILSVKIV